MKAQSPSPTARRRSAPAAAQQAAYCRRGAQQTPRPACPIRGHGVASLGRGAVGAQDDILEDLRLVMDADDLASDVDRHIVAGFGRQHVILLPAGANDKFNAQNQ